MLKKVLFSMLVLGVLNLNGSLREPGRRVAGPGQFVARPGRSAALAAKVLRRGPNPLHNQAPRQHQPAPVVVNNAKKKLSFQEVEPLRENNQIMNQALLVESDSIKVTRASFNVTPSTSIDLKIDQSFNLELAEELEEYATLLFNAFKSRKLEPDELVNFEKKHPVVQLFKNGYDVNKICDFYNFSPKSDILARFYMAHFKAMCRTIEQVDPRLTFELAYLFTLRARAELVLKIANLLKCRIA
ncbi:MAG: hypothetical protein UR26_C0003G0115 [candidate division TM6 bacterium GW2011_GWF2_32_72]|nr:MAG: hypothetical protein UR26_C0003G0115 [candidate division TM6 bacterium GW2011_GWF2_32_72]